MLTHKSSNVQPAVQAAIDYLKSTPTPEESTLMHHLDKVKVPLTTSEVRELKFLVLLLFKYPALAWQILHIIELNPH